MSAVDWSNYITPEELLRRAPFIKKRTLRYWLAESQPKKAYRSGREVTIPGNGLERAVVRKGRLYFIKEREFFEWFEGRKEAA